MKHTIFTEVYLNIINEEFEQNIDSQVELQPKNDSAFIPVPDVENYRNPEVEAAAYAKQQEANPILGHDWSWRIFHQIMHPHDDRYIFLDLSKDLYEYRTLPLPTNQDEQRIYDIVRKASYEDRYERYGSFTGGIANMNIRKAVNLADTMNKLISNEDKRKARKQAAEKYGLIFIAREFI